MMSEKPVVLVVEDEALIRLGALDLVESAGCTAVEARDADEAIRILESRPDIRLIFTDIDMPGSMDGLKLSHYVRNRWPPIHIIVASGKAIIAESELPAGARFFPKPYQGEPITEAIAGFFHL
jgi:CheY-like chemotaxis protein